MGGGGDGMIIAESALVAAAAGASFKVRGFLDDNRDRGDLIYGLPVIGKLEDWPSFSQETVFIPALHNISERRSRLKRIISLGVPLERWITVQHPQAIVARDVSVGRGTYIGPFSVIEPSARISNFVCIRSGAYISHETVVEDFSFIGANSTIAGRSIIGRGTHIGPNSVIRDRIAIAEFTIVGIGAVVTKSVTSTAVIAGNPARALKQSDQKSGARIDR